MRNKMLLLVVIMLLSVTTSVAQTSYDLFTWQNGTVKAGSFLYRQYEPSQPTTERQAHLESREIVLHTIPVQCESGQYKCNVQILGTQGIDESDSHIFYQIQLRDQYNNNLIFKRFGAYCPFTTTKSLSQDYGDLNYFRKVDLDNVSYALFFTGMTPTLDDDFGELLIVVVSRNVATIVYDGPAAAYKPAVFTPSFVSLYIVTEGDGLRNPETGLYNLTPQTVKHHRKSVIYKFNNILKISEWTIGNGPTITLPLDGSYTCPNCGYASDKSFAICPACHWHNVY